MTKVYNTPTTVTADDYFLKSLGAFRKFELLNNQLVLHLSCNFRERDVRPSPLQLTTNHNTHWLAASCSVTGISFLHFRRRSHRRRWHGGRRVITMFMQNYCDQNLFRIIYYIRSTGGVRYRKYYKHIICIGWFTKHARRLIQLFI